MSALTIIFCIWATVAIGAILLVRGANLRTGRPAPSRQRQPSRFSIAE
ncbi:MAG TPA: hypothetical protein VFE79_04735 [Paraburkholderia sp.]|jgi:hypothetical protein|nr:hypothetical protein [Paraburkholderia sp.]